MLDRRAFVATGLGIMGSLALAGCGGGGGTSTGSSPSNDAKGKVYYLNFKPEQDAQWQELAEAYTEETGVPVTVKTAASGEYETTLKAEMAKSKAPTLFQVNGPVGLASWKDYCYDLDDADILKTLTSDSFALKGDDGKVKSVAYVIETYGLIYNKELLSKAGYEQKDITNFASLKAAVEDITSRKDELGFSAFTSCGMDSSSDWRFKTHLANLPIYYEYKADGISTTDAIKGTYLPQYRQIWELYINNSTCEPGVISTKTADDATAEFITGKACFYQNGTWEYANIAEIGDDNLGMLPIYIGAEGEDAQGLCTGSENYWCVNNKASEDDIKATLDFINWCVTSDAGTKAMCGAAGAMPSGADGMGFVIPFEGNLESENKLNQIADEYVADGKTPVDWCFSTMPSEEWKNGVGSALTTFASDQSDANWDAVKTAFVDGWATEAAATK
ncbi:ABC transporter substrate-binding protein [Collinsella tanakaei]|uniref:ABC transporter substrate-binding protein n=1 Tax=Collinsella tanakaei TaxID=626935 RepID=UPI002F94CF31